MMRKRHYKRKHEDTQILYVNTKEHQSIFDKVLDFDTDTCLLDIKKENTESKFMDMIMESDKWFSANEYREALNLDFSRYFRDYDFTFIINIISFIDDIHVYIVGKPKELMHFKLKYM